MQAVILSGYKLSEATIFEEYLQNYTASKPNEVQTRFPTLLTSQVAHINEVLAKSIKILI
jgi:hypothetical protein